MKTEIEWWQQEDLRGYLTHALSHIKSANTSWLLDEVRCCNYLFQALNCLWTAHRRSTKTLEDSGDSTAIKNLLIDGISVPDKQWLCESTQVMQFAQLSPPVLNHKKLQNSSKYSPHQSIPPNLQQEASDEHRQLARAMNRWKDTPSDETLRALLKKLAQMLYIVRSNIAHGEKTPFGPDLKKAERDRQVCFLTKPVLAVLFEALFNHPEHRLAVYGSLALGQPNHSAIAEMPGTWEDGFVNGELKQINDLPAFKWILSGEKVAVNLFTSTILKEQWERLDRFEGKQYQRILVPVAQSEGRVTIANLYEVRNLQSSVLNFLAN